MLSSPCVSWSYQVFPISRSQFKWCILPSASWLTAQHKQWSKLVTSSNLISRCLKIAKKETSVPCCKITHLGWEPELGLLHGELVLHGGEDQDHLRDDHRPQEGDVHCTHPEERLEYLADKKHCRRHNGPEGWVHITSSNTNLDHNISSSESRPSINF